MAPSGLKLVSPVCVAFPWSFAKPFSAYLCSLLFSLRAETPSLWTKYLPENFRPSPKPLLSLAQTINSHKGLEKAGATRMQGTGVHVFAGAQVEF